MKILLTILTFVIASLVHWFLTNIQFTNLIDHLKKQEYGWAALWLMGLALVLSNWVRFFNYL